MGIRSRRKGLRTEYLLRDYLRERGYEAFRVPLSGASEGYKGDVVATKNGVSWIFEMKARKSAFKKIYEDFLALKQTGITWRFSVGDACVAIGTDFEDIKQVVDSRFPVLDTKFTRAGRRIFKLAEMLGGADYLVIKGDNKPMLFIRYWL